ncbi:HAD family phosphatase [Candidatus Woesearchaeota archaeon]|nr:HAD family phosphatase [Candidatus Woesearchaeota archaeon]
MIKAVIFDYNGTLVDDLRFHEMAYFGAAKEMGIKISIETIKKNISLAPQEKIRLIFGEELAAGESRKIFDLVYKHYKKLVGKKNIVFNGVPEVLSYLSKKYVLGLVSNTRKERFEEFFPKNLAAKFRATVFGYETENPKPHPDPLLLASKKLNCEVKDCIYIGDSPLDAQAAKAAKMKLILIASGRDRKQKLMKCCDTVLDDITELKKIL